jgi:hypothetical protein
VRSTTARTAAAGPSVLAVLLTPPPPPPPPTQPPAPATQPRCRSATPSPRTPSRPSPAPGTSGLKFRHWTDADRDGCSTRNEALLDEAVTPPEQEASCRLTGGSWYSPYDDSYFTAARALDIDNLAPLAEAWHSGASTWTATERETYTNDLDDPRALIAVSATSNRSKADQNPPTWMPPAGGYRCTYATDWITIKTRWNLTIDQTEQTTLTDILDGCPNTPVEITLAR